MYRGKVFANAQTGNIVLLAQNLIDRNGSVALRYFSPLLFFALGVAAAECIHMRYQKAQRIHWRQLVLAIEILLLFAVGFFPNEMDLLANAVDGPVNISATDLARQLGLSRASLYRAFDALEQADLIRRSGKTIEVPSLPALQSVL